MTRFMDSSRSIIQNILHPMESFRTLSFGARISTVFSLRVPLQQLVRYLIRMHEYSLLVQNIMSLTTWSTLLLKSMPETSPFSF